MAVKTRAQRLTVLKEIRDLWAAEVTDYATFLTNLGQLLAALEAGDPETGDADMFNAAEALRTVRDNYGAAIIAAYFACHKMLGNYASTLNVNDVQTNLAMFHDKLVADGDAFLERIATGDKPASFSAGGSNVGDGLVMVAKVAAAQGGDVGHVQTWKLRCISAAPDTQTGAEEFEISGGVLGLYPTQEGGTAGSEGYQFRGSYGLSSNLPSPSQAVDGAPGAQSAGAKGVTCFSVGTSAESGNLIADGGFEGGSTTTFGGDWTATGSVARNTTTPIEGNADAKFTGDGNLMQEGLGIRLASGCYFGMTAWASKSGTPTGDLHITLEDDNATYLDVTVDVSTLSGTPTPLTFKTVFLPDSVDVASLRIEADIANWGSAGGVYVDKIMLRKLVTLEGIAVGPVGGITPTAKNDVFTASVAQTNADNLQYLNNRAFGRGLPSANPAVNWGD
jgi:hypothetical protein